MRKIGKGKEHDTTTHLIDIPTLVVLLKLVSGVNHETQKRTVFEPQNKTALMLRILVWVTKWPPLLG